jgi:hypothetical protein
MKKAQKSSSAGTEVGSSTKADNTSVCQPIANALVGGSGMLRFNLNYNVKVKIRDAGIEHYVRKHNSIMPFQLHTSFKEFKSKADVDGYHTMQMHSFMDDFGCEGLRLANLVDLNILIFQKDVSLLASVK